MITSSIVALAILLNSLGQDKVEQQKPLAVAQNKTEYENFASANGVLMIKEVFSLGAVTFKFGKTEAEVIRITKTQSGESAICLIFSHEKDEQYSLHYTSILDRNEIDSLASALNYIKSNRKKLIKEAKTYTEISYTSRGGFVAGFYIKEGGESQDYIKVGGEAVFLREGSLEEVIKQAQSKIREIEIKE